MKQLSFDFFDIDNAYIFVFLDNFPFFAYTIFNNENVVFQTKNELKTGEIFLWKIKIQKTKK